MTELREAGEITTGALLDGRYRLEERIGEGGMARVYRAEDTALGRTVAIKLLRAPVDGQGDLERAHSETTLLASLSHHGLVTLYDAKVSESEGSYLVMEFVDGITLRERMSQGPIAPAEAAWLAVDIAEALHVAHIAGIVHRDIKPSNVLLWKSPLPGREWRAKIADFGIAHLLDSGRITTPGLMVGTVAYIAPEQARGAEPAPAADIYALGLVLIEALTGTRPFADAEGIGTVMVRLQRSPTMPDWLDERWRQLLSWMTAMRPEDRPTALDVTMAASRLTSLVVPARTDEPTVAASPVANTGATAVMPLAALGTDPGSVGAGSAPVRKRRRMVPAVVMSALILASLIGGGIWATTSLLGVPEPAPTQPVEEQVVEPDVEQAPVVEQPAPVVEPEDNSGNGNSGPGNGKGEDKGKGKGKGGKD